MIAGVKLDYSIAVRDALDDDLTWLYGDAVSFGVGKILTRVLKNRAARELCSSLFEAVAGEDGYE